ncbi:unnamed protein product [Mytilus coruscus]|uniref:Uncharacterized protein n=1 Tax=Mytilus coruscus TaxID=42192 RepID=A0A6J8AFG6_MYTCO|nr:unnamed protein product [Mytilus coruscus]
MNDNTSKSSNDSELSSTDEEGYSSVSRRKRMRRSSFATLPKSLPQRIAREINMIIKKLGHVDLQVLQEEEISKRTFRRVTPITNVQKFIYHMKKFIDDILRYNRVKTSRLGVPEGLLRQLFGKFAELCCYGHDGVEFCNEANQSVWENLDGIENVASQPDLRLYKCGFNNKYTGEMITVKPREEDFESNEPPRKKYKRRGRNYAGSEADTYMSAENSDVIELDLQDSVLGQHAGQLLLDLNREYINKEANYYEDDRKINMPGMIVNGTYVYITVLDMTWKHYQKLRTNKTLDENDRATIYYTHAGKVSESFDRRVPETQQHGVDLIFKRYYYFKKYNKMNLGIINLLKCSKIGAPRPNPSSIAIQAIPTHHLCPFGQIIDQAC